jgi:hypothetical protein
VVHEISQVIGIVPLFWVDDVWRRPAGWLCRDAVFGVGRDERSGQ